MGALGVGWGVDAHSHTGIVLLVSDVTLLSFHMVSATR